jgi:hypothetical protein
MSNAMSPEQPERDIRASTPSVNAPHSERNPDEPAGDETPPATPDPDALGNYVDDTNGEIPEPNEPA